MSAVRSNSRSLRSRNSLGGSTSPLDLTPFFDDWLFTPGWFGVVCGAPDLDAALSHWARPASRD